MLSLFAARQALAEERDASGPPAEPAFAADASPPRPPSEEGRPEGGEASPGPPGEPLHQAEAAAQVHSAGAPDPHVDEAAAPAASATPAGEAQPASHQAASPAVADDDVFDLSFEDLTHVELSSAAKQPERLAEVAASAIVITRSQIEAYGFTTLEEFFTTLPGMYLVDTYEDLQVGVRGTLGGAVQVLVNGIPRHPVRTKGLSVPERERFNIPIESIDRIEIVRGPMSVMYGNNAFLGSINIITNDVDNGGSQISLGYGTRHSSRLSWRQTHRFGDRAFLVFNGGYYRTDGIGGDLKDTMSAAQLATLDPGMKRSLDGMLSHNDLSVGGYVQYKGLWTDLRWSAMRYGIYVLTPSFDQGNRLGLDTLHASVGYSRALSDLIAVSGQAIYSNETYDLAADSVAPDVFGWQRQGSRRVEGELLLKLTPTDGLRVLAGYNHQQIFDIHNSARVPTIDFFLQTDASQVRREDVFLHVKQSLFGRLTLSGGVRVSYIAPHHVNSMQGSIAAGVAPDDEQAFKGEFRYVPMVSAIVSVTPHHVLKAVGGMAIQNSRGYAFQDPERISSAEIIYLLDYRRWSLQASVYGFQTEKLVRTVQEYDATSGKYVKHQDNSGELQTVGCEVMGRLVPLERLDIDLSLSVQKTEDRHNPTIAVGNSPAFLPKLRSAYRLPLPGQNELQFGLTGSYVSGMKTDWQWSMDTAGAYARVGADVPGYLLLSANVRYTHLGSGVWLNLHGSNLLDWDVRYPAGELVQFAKGGFGPRRLIMVTAGSAW